LAGSFRVKTLFEKRLTCETYSSIDDVPLEQWDGLAKAGPIAYSSDFLRVIEQSGIEGIKDFHYIILHNGDVPVCIATCYSFKADLVDYTNDVVKSIVIYLRRYFPNLLFIKILECGSAININASPFIAKFNTRPEQVFPSLKNCLRDIGKRIRATVIGIKDLSYDFIKSESLLQSVSQDNFTIIGSVPGTFVPLRWRSIDEYLGQMKSYYRSKLDKHLRRNIDNNISSELIEDFSALSEKLAQQWMTVHENTTESKREVLNSIFYKNLSMALEEESKVLLFYSGEELVGHALIVFDKTILRWLYIGKNKVSSDSLYIYMMYKVIETGISLGAEAIDCGPTNYDIKRDLGAKIDPQYYAMTLNLPFIEKFASPMFRKLSNHDVPKNRNIFKSKDSFSFKR
jgi:predicted N-acyltransferase